MSIYISRDTSMSTLATELLNEKPEELADADLLRGVDLMTASNRYLALENEVLELYLQRMDPDLLNGVQEMLSATPARPRALSSHILLHPLSRSDLSLSSRRGTEESSSLHQVRSFTRPIGSATLMPHVLDRGPRINMSNKEDIASRETDDLRAALDKLHVTSMQTRANLKAQLEETQMTLLEIQEAHANLVMVIGAVDPITGRIPAEKFVRHLEEWLKKEDSMVEKLRLRTSTLRSMLIRVNQLLEQKEELGEKLHPIDFEQLKIENKQFSDKIEQKNHNLLEMKKITGRSNLLLTKQKKKMQDQMMELSQIQEDLSSKETQVKNMENEADVVEVEVEKASVKLDNIRELIDNYSAPDVMEYVKKKAELHELNQALKAWSRRKKIQQTALIACKRVLRKLTTTSMLPDRDDLEESQAKLSAVQEIENEDSIFSFASNVQK